LRIAVVYDVIYPWVKGGVEKRVWEIARRLTLRHDVHLYGMKFWEGDDVIEKEGVRIHGVCRPKELYKDGRRSITEAIYFTQKVLKPLLQEKYDIIDCQQFPYFTCISAKLHSLLHRTKLVITWHEIWDHYWYEYLGSKGVFGVFIERAVARITKNNVAVSHTTAYKLKKLGTESHVIPNGMNFNEVQCVKPGEYCDAIFVGRLIKEKNVDKLIEAVSILKRDKHNLKCVIVGDGPERQTLERLAQKLDVQKNIVFKGFIQSYHDVIALMKGAKVLVLPSTREGFGIVVIEANACGIPVVTVDHPGNAARDLIIKGENGYLTSLTPGLLAKTMMQALNDTTKLCKKCICHAKFYDWNNIALELEEYYISVLNKQDKRIHYEHFGRI